MEISLINARLSEIESDVMAIRTDIVGIRGKIDLIDIRQTMRDKNADLSKKSMWQEESEKMEVLAEKNFQEWRDYLYKFAFVMITVLGFLISLIATRWIGEGLDISKIELSLNLIGASLVGAFLTIFYSMYLERRFEDAEVNFALGMEVGNCDHKDAVHPFEALRLNTKTFINKNKADLKKTTDPKMRRTLRLRIRADKKALRKIKYMGVKLTTYDAIRFSITAVVIGLSLAGMFVLSRELLRHTSAQQAVTQTDVRFLGEHPLL